MATQPPLAPELLEPALNIEDFPFSFSEEIHDITEDDYLRAQPDVDYILPDAKAVRTERLEFFSEAGFALTEDDSVDYIAEEYAPRERTLTYMNYPTTETWLQWRISNKVPRKLQLSEIPGLLNLPFEILALIFIDLHPIDYLHLSQSCKALYDYFSSRANRPLWRDAFRRFERIPECPPDFIEPRWAAFMWGKDCCDVCGGTHSGSEWYLRRRLCKPCLLAKTVKPDENAGPAFAYLAASYDEDRYWAEDVLETEMKLEEYTVLLGIEGPIAEMEMTMFMDQKTALLLLIKEHGDICRRWARNLSYDHDSRQERKKDAVVKRIRQLFRVAGHHKGDTEEADISIEDDEKLAHRYLTRYHFQTLKPRFIDAVDEARKNRLVREHEEAVRTREVAIRDRINEWMRGNPAWSWGFQPHSSDFATAFSELFHDLVHAEGSAPISSDGLENAVEKVDEAVINWRLRKMNELAGLLPEDLVHDLYGQGVTEKADLGSLELATAIFDCQCSDYGAFVGWSEAGEHMCCCSFQFSRRGTDAAKALVELVGLDPKITSATTMDRLGDRFICGSCPAETQGRTTGRKAWTWRDAILHYVKATEDDSHSIPSWLLLTKAATKDVCLRETHPENDSREWACCHCGRNWLLNHDNKAQVKQHLREEHDITRPVEGLDLYIYQGYRRPREGQAFLVEATLYRCKYCPMSDKLLTMEQMTKHLKAKSHAAIIPGDEIIHVPTIERVTVHFPSTELEIEQPKEGEAEDGSS